MRANALPTPTDYCEDIAVAGTFENQILYGMCFDHPGHTDPAVVKGKIIAIGRIYAASPQRGAGTPKTGNPDVFEAIASALCEQGLDEMLANLPQNERVDRTWLAGVIDLHTRFKTIVFDAIKANSEPPKGHTRATGQPWRPSYHPSFASKYLHFHRPNMIPIYDSIAATGLAKFKGRKTNSRYQDQAAGYGRYCADWLDFAADFSKNRLPPGWHPRAIDTDLLLRGT